MLGSHATRTSASAHALAALPRDASSKHVYDWRHRLANHPWVPEQEVLRELDARLRLGDVELYCRREFSSRDKCNGRINIQERIGPRHDERLVTFCTKCGTSYPPVQIIRGVRPK